MTDDKLKNLPLTRHLPKASVICHLSFVIRIEPKARFVLYAPSQIDDNSPHAAKRARNSTTLRTPSRTSFARRFDPKTGTKTRVNFSTDSGSNHYRTLRRGTTLGPPEYFLAG